MGRDSSCERQQGQGQGREAVKTARSQLARSQAHSHALLEWSRSQRPCAGARRAARVRTGLAHDFAHTWRWRHRLLLCPCRPDALKQRAGCYQAQRSSAALSHCRRALQRALLVTSQRKVLMEGVSLGVPNGHIRNAHAGRAHRWPQPSAAKRLVAPTVCQCVRMTARAWHAADELCNILS